MTDSRPSEDVSKSTVTDPGGTPSSAPLISVVVPAYNAQATLAQALGSLMRQRWPQLEIIVVDDGSFDATAAIARSFTALEAPGRRVVVLSQDNAGVSAARNAGIAAATGELITFLDADDELLPGALSTGMRARAQLGEGRWLVYPQAVQITSGGLHADRTLNKEAMPAPIDQRATILQYNFGAMTALFPREFFAEVGTFDESMTHGEDWQLWMRAVFCGWRFHRLPEILWMVYWSPGSLTSQREKMDAGEDQALRSVLAAHGEQMTPAERAFIDRRLEAGSPQTLLFRMAQNLRVGKLHEAKTQLDTAASLMPSQRRVVLKQRISSLPGGLRWLRRRQEAIDHRIDYDAELGR